MKIRRRSDAPTVGLGAGIYVVSPDGRILLVEQERDTVAEWGSLGGRLEAGETIEQCAMREAYEESGLRVRIVRLLSVDEFWSAGALVHVGFVFLAAPEPWPQEVALPEMDGDTRFLGYRWAGRPEIASVPRLAPDEICATRWPPDITETTLRTLAVEP